MLRALFGCQDVQSCQNQTASLLLTGEGVSFCSVCVCVFFFSKIIILKAFLSKPRTYRHPFFLEFITVIKKSAFYFPLLAPVRHIPNNSIDVNIRKNVFNCFFFCFYVSLPYKACSFFFFFSIFCHYFYSLRLFRVERMRLTETERLDLGWEPRESRFLNSFLLSVATPTAF